MIGHTLTSIPFAVKFLIVMAATIGMSLIFTPIMTFVSKRIGAVDKPNKRRVNTKVMPSAGGLAIFLAFLISTTLLLPLIVHPQPIAIIQFHPLKVQIGTYLQYSWPFLLGAAVIVMTGLIDDIKELAPRWKMLGMVIASVMIWLFTHARFDNIKIPFGGPLIVFPAWLSLILTVFWIVAITNAVNLIDGLDGLASGVSIISLMTMGIVALFFLPSLNVFLPIMIFTLAAAILGFFPYNYHPAIIFLGDTGALFLGFMISVFSLLGLKNATAVAVLTPLLILGVPLTDTVVAMIRRRLNQQSISTADKMHLHHRLMALGFTHRGAVLVIYAIAAIFAFISLILQVSGRLGGILMVIASLIGLEIFFELLGVLGRGRQPILNALRFVGNSDYRNKTLGREEEEVAESENEAEEDLDLDQTKEIPIPVRKSHGKRSDRN